MKNKDDNKKRQCPHKPSDPTGCSLCCWRNGASGGPRPRPRPRPRPCGDTLFRLHMNPLTSAAKHESTLKDIMSHILPNHPASHNALQTIASPMPTERGKVEVLSDGELLSSQRTRDANAESVCQRTEVTQSPPVEPAVHSMHGGL